MNGPAAAVPPEETIRKYEPAVGAPTAEQAAAVTLNTPTSEVGFELFADLAPAGTATDANAPSEATTSAARASALARTVDFVALLTEPPLSVGSDRSRDRRNATMPRPAIRTPGITKNHGKSAKGGSASTAAKLSRLSAITPTKGAISRLMRGQSATNRSTAGVAPAGRAAAGIATLRISASPLPMVMK